MSVPGTNVKTKDPYNTANNFKCLVVYVKVSLSYMMGWTRLKNTIKIAIEYLQFVCYEVYRRTFRLVRNTQDWKRAIEKNKIKSRDRQ